MSDRGHPNGHTPLKIALVGVALLLLIAAVIAGVSQSNAPTTPAETPAVTRVPQAAPRPVARLTPADPEPSAADCAPRELPVGDSTRTGFIGLDEVSWLVVVPSTYQDAERHPLVVLLHQNFETAKQFVDYSGFRSLAEEHQFVVVAPQADRINEWSAQHAVDVVQRAVSATSEQLCIDPNRVFVVGHGAGGETAMELSCEPWITAIATNSYRRSTEQKFCGVTPRPKPHIMMSPLRSPREPPEGGRPCHRQTGTALASLQTVERAWRRRNDCDPDASRTRQGCTQWTSCRAPFVSCHVDGGHPWPGAPPRGNEDTIACDGEPPDYPTADRIWQFFADL